MRIKPVYTYQTIVFLTGFLICFIGVTIEDYNHGYSLERSLSEWHHYIAPLFMGLSMSAAGQIFWKRRTNRISAQKAMVESEKKYRTLYENMIDTVCILDNKKCIIDVNQASTELFGYDYDELLGMSIDEFLYSDDKAVSDQFFENLEKEGSYSMYEGRVVTKTGKIKWIQVNSTEIREDGNKIGSQDIIRDISSRKNIEIQLQETVRQLNELNTTKDKLFSIIAHDLRSPFNSILGFTQLLLNQLKDSVDEKQVNSLKTINTTAQSTLYLLENLLDWAKTQTGQIDFNPTIISLKSMFEGITEIMKSSVIIKNISIEHTLSDDIELLADENMLRSVIHNLVSNAVKFTGIGGSIVLSAKTEGHLVEISISDNGVGITKEIQEKLFDIESNTSTPGTLNEKGSGLGLVLCKEFIVKHSGRIWVESDGKSGSTFKVSLPA